MVLLLAGGVIAFVIVFVVLLSNASFIEQSKSQDNRFGAGDAALELSTSGKIVDATDMRNGTTRDGDIGVTNRGERARVSVTLRGAETGPALADELDLKIFQPGSQGNPEYDGILGEMGTVELGTWPRGTTRDYTFEIHVPLLADPGLSGTSLDASFDWEARTPG